MGITQNNNTQKMKVEIWSDIMCPFCYIGKRQFENALKQFEDSKHIEIIWKSFILDPMIPERSEDGHMEYLVKHKGLSEDRVKDMLDNVVNYAKSVGLDYDLENGIIVNSKKSHRLIQFAKTKGLGNEIEERLFSAFFVEAKDLSDLTILTQLGKDVGLDENELQIAFTEDTYEELMNADIQEARQLGVSGVPFFVFDRKYAVSGAQQVEAFLQTLEKSHGEWREANPEVKLEVISGDVCRPDGTCD